MSAEAAPLVIGVDLAEGEDRTEWTYIEATDAMTFDLAAQGVTPLAFRRRNAQYKAGALLVLQDWSHSRRPRQRAYAIEGVTPLDAGNASLLWLKALEVAGP